MVRMKGFTMKRRFDEGEGNGRCGGIGRGGKIPVNNPTCKTRVQFWSIR